MEISILQWNVWYQEDIRHILTFLKTHPADIICLQELPIDIPSQSEAHAPRYLASQLNYNYHYKALPLGTIDGQTISWADGIFTRFPVIEKTDRFINKPQDGRGYDNECRAYVELTVKAGKTPFSVATTHLSYTDKFRETARKKREADELVEIIKNRSKNYMLTGDLNVTPGSYTIGQISKHLKHAGPDFSQNTWTTKPFSYRGFEAKTLDWRLDYIFASPDINVVSAEIITTNFSDHLPILAKIKL